MFLWSMLIRYVGSFVGKNWFSFAINILYLCHIDDLKCLFDMIGVVVSSSMACMRMYRFI